MCWQRRRDSLEGSGEGSALVLERGGDAFDFFVGVVLLLLLGDDDKRVEWVDSVLPLVEEPNLLVQV